MFALLAFNPVNVELEGGVDDSIDEKQVKFYKNRGRCTQ